MRYIISLFFLIVCNVSWSQNININKFKEYCNNLDIKEIISRNEEITIANVFPDKKDSINYNTPLLKELQQSLYLEKTPFYEQIVDCTLVIRVEIASSAENYNKGESIYKHLDIVKGKQSVIFTNDNNTVIGISINLTYPFGYFNVNNDVRSTNKDKIDLLKRAKAYEEILKHKPEVIMFSLTFNIKHKTFLFIKNSKIYVYRYKRHKKYELNEYINKFFRPCNIKKLAEHSSDMKAVIFFGIDKKFLKCE